ncbi:hypothetical protein QBC34DRAFT_195100 [Podospora aff. communis PSN243]|uniref:Phosphatidate phosphatase APP1 catalytic domain-containing protein n=1 Tax=Podospora aff. communis PSN243 TaxID=3040156 RepID=A0AAV9GYR6_9PEZI|nr:hypothetical protein QBC34DRAFT_195100 [Podospora aff. communis PSN243]
MLLSLLPLHLGLALAIPNPAPAPHPMITPAPAPLDSRDLVTEWDNYVNSVVSGLGSTVSGYIASGIPQFFQDLPTGQDVEIRLGIADRDLDAKPTQVLNLPAYGNYTEDGWNVFVHGNVYKVPDISEDKLNDLADGFLIDTDMDDLSPAQQAQARNLTASIFVVQQAEVNVTIDFVVSANGGVGSEKGTVEAAGGGQSIPVPEKTTDQGDFAGWLKLENTTGSAGGHLLRGNETIKIQTLEMHAQGTDSGNATAYLVPPRGVTIISDIDDILRVTKIWDPKEGVLNSFVRPFAPWMNMPEIYAEWARRVDDLHFHYLTTTPEQATRNYMAFTLATYPLGSFDTRPLNFSDVAATLSIRKYLLDRIFGTYPQRKFILVGDTSNSDVLKAYPQLARDHGDMVQCIWLRNTSSTDSSYRFPYNTSGFEGLPTSKYMFFRVPDDLQGLDLTKGECVNNTFPQNVTFGMQGSALGSDAGGIAVLRSGMLAMTAALFATVLAVWC